MNGSYLFIGLVTLLAIWVPYKWLLCVFLIGMLIFYLRHFKVKIAMLVLLLSLLLPVFPKPIEPLMSKILKVHEVHTNYVIAQAGKTKALVYTDTPLGFDDIIQVSGNYESINTIHNINDFHFQTWLARRNIHYQIQNKNVRILKEGTSFRHRILSNIQKKKDQQAATWLEAMLFGIHETELSYFITSSGMHIAFLMSALERFLTRYIHRQKAMLCVIVLSGCLGICTSFTTAIWRILCFRGIRLVFDRLSYKDQVGLGMVVLLRIFPYMAYELGFLLPVAFMLVGIFHRAKRPRWALSLSIMIPFQFLFFHSCNPISILIFPYLRKAYAFLYILCLLYGIFPYPYFTVFFTWLSNALSTFETIGFESFYRVSFPWLLLWLVSLIHYIEGERKAKYKLCILFLYTFFAPYLNPFGEIYIIDVGQGDCTLISLPYGQGVMLVDVMGSKYKNIPKDIIMEQLRMRGIRKIDTVLLTHDDYDHSGGLKELQECIPITQIITEKQEKGSIRNYEFPIVLYDYQHPDSNENSIITYFDFYGLRVLLMGDAGVGAEAELMKKYPKLEVDVLKLGHHGSKTSSSLPFLHQLQPSLALISAGRNNRYGHPHQEVLKHLKQEHITALMTPKEGGISIKFCKFFAFFKTASGEFGIIKHR
ncbi:ComEC/Rec2 family competence protein [Amedibacillus dolichus]|uniref:Putative DNA internalization competence protein ComEC/Rec2-like protein n=2 Tax=Amedibacillus dolichus TaxID=31971 RepID=A8RCA5_9FIRM|nr:MBL fold metallo-hydrolase [Amedibacillus dolichus]EDP11405.1 putative DNA internalization competence protein ComEC/Rec2-like protein [Amedibacillus dolichus DSM 3991]